LAGTILYVNPAFEALTGYSKDDALGKSHALIKSGIHSPAFYAKLWVAIGEGREFRAVFVNRKKSGELYHEEKLIRPFVDAQGGATHYVSVGRDVSATVRAVEWMEFMATHDLLTGLPNRVLFKDRLHREFAHARSRNCSFALCFLDVDKLKPVNDLYGHAAGDTLLRTVASVLKRKVRDIDTAARLGGDEFGLIFADVACREEVQCILADILEELRTGAASQHCRLPPSLSIGGSLYPDDGVDERTLLIRADQAMYRAKSSGGDSFCFFDAEQDGAVELGMENALVAEEGFATGFACPDLDVLPWPRLAAGSFHAHCRDRNLAS
jgi:diguanylate cyclase (GGDEF)-like protein/PAS domain S-box-containing protein